MMNRKFKAGETRGTYVLAEPVTAEEILTMANKLARSKLSKGKALTSPSLTYSCLQTLLQEYEHEVFGILFLDSQHRVIKFEELFRGTLDGATVYPREVVKAALACNAAAVILVHNHPSGLPEPSRADRSLTERLQVALGVVEIRLLDHLVIGTEGRVSMAERGWI
ncbi:DNA repair protein RadC [Aeromonas simiae]|uniref:RadC family protein n=1 Tax=Aeromonas simiae TaxID=218936 RepID=UPI001C596512|nr:DNA repair protein RadC [Aeromonas simiae]MDO2949070.1 DNA repair protein RadC [Aeromonas simiae]MDO2956335.1 DNA repair protein RadC [Aeromonas simiae]QXW31703.1 DNA repair protein RadC [Aeromonas sanarellii]